MGGDSCSVGGGFESLHHILDRHFFTNICCKNCNVCLNRRKWTKKRPWMAQFLKKRKTFPTKFESRALVRSKFVATAKSNYYLLWTGSAQSECLVTFPPISVSVVCGKTCLNHFDIFFNFLLYLSLPKYLETPLPYKNCLQRHFHWSYHGLYPHSQ